MRHIKAVLLIMFMAVLTATAATDVSDKRIAILGDSMTWIGGDSCQNDCGWTYHFVNLMHPRDVDIYARSGATWTNTTATRPDTKAYTEILDDRNVIYNQALRMVEAVDADETKRPDIIIIYAGANDAWFSKRRPGIFDTASDFSPSPFTTPLPDRQSTLLTPEKCTSLESSMRLVFSILADKFPDCRILVITPAEMTKVPVDSITRVSDIIDATAQAAGYEVLRADREVDIRRARELKKFTDTSDGVHTNSSGARKIARFVADRL